jgi:hypothetical protein
MSGRIVLNELHPSGSLPINVPINILKGKIRNNIQITIAGLVISLNYGKTKCFSM